MKTRKIAAAAAAAALIYVVTILIVVPMPAIKGSYFHFGDVMIYCAAFIIGGPFAAIAAGAGSALADLTVGAQIYIPATFAIKACMAVIVGVMTKKNDSFYKYAVSCVLAALLMAFGYFGYETMIAGIGLASATLVPNLVQGGAGAVIAMFLYRPMLMLRRKMTIRYSA